MNQQLYKFPTIVRSALVCLLLILSACARRGTISASLDSTRDVHEAASDASNYGKPVKIEGVVTYYDPEWHLLFLQDASGGFFLKVKENVPDVKPGKLLEVAGRLAPSNIGIEDPEIRVLGNATLPTPQALPDTSADPTKLLSQWIQVQGTIRAAWYEEGRLTLSVANGAQRVRLRVL